MRRFRQKTSDENERPRWSGLLAPFFLMLLHVIVLNAVSNAYFAVRLVVSGDAAGFSSVSLLPADTLRRLMLEYDVQNIGSILAAVILIPIYLIYLSLNKDRLPYRFKPVSLDQTMNGFLMIFASLGCVNLWMMLLQVLAEYVPFLKRQLDHYDQLAQQLSPNASNLFLQLVALVVLIPITEELLFRGIVQGTIARYVPRWINIILSSLVFAVFHGQFIQSSYVIFPSLALGFACAVTGSLVLPIMMHTVFNFLGSTVATFVAQDVRFAVVYSILLLLSIPAGIFSAVRLWLEESRIS